MKRTAVILAIVPALLLFAVPAQAFVAVSADAVLNYDYTGGGEQSDIIASGYKLGVSLPLFFLGLGYERYTVTSTVQQSPPLNSIGFESQVTMYDVFADLPFPVLNLTVGAGVGKATLQGTDKFSGAVVFDFDDAAMTQLFASIGYPFAGILDVHLGVHSIKGEAKLKGGGGTADLAATMLTLGLRVGF